MKIPRLSMLSPDKASGVGYLKQYSVQDTYPLHSHDFYEFFYVIEGRAIHNINGENQLLTKGSLVFIRPSDVHKYSYLDNFDMQVISCGVTKDMIISACRYLRIAPSELERPALPGHIVLEGPEFWNLEKNLNGIANIGEGAMRRQYFTSILPGLLYLFTSGEGRRNTAVVPVWLSELIAKMEIPENYIGGLGTMLSIANVSQEHLNRVFKTNLNTTPTRFINAKRIHYASKLLLERKYEIIDICYMSGFNNLTYFYKNFKKHHKCTPKQFIGTYSGDGRPADTLEDTGRLPQL